MATHTWHPSHESPELARFLVTGFISGAVAVLVFHQAALGVLNSLGLTDRAPFLLQATAPFGVPLVWSLTFWGGLWGIALAAVFRRFDGPALITGATLFGVLAPTLVAWFIVAPLRGQPMAAGFDPAAMAVALLVNGAWGLGTGAFLVLFGRSHVRGRRFG